MKYNTKKVYQVRSRRFGVKYFKELNTAREYVGEQTFNSDSASVPKLVTLLVDDAGRHFEKRKVEVL